MGFGPLVSRSREGLGIWTSAKVILRWSRSSTSRFEFIYETWPQGSRGSIGDLWTRRGSWVPMRRYASDRIEVAAVTRACGRTCCKSSRKGSTHRLVVPQPRYCRRAKFKIMRISSPVLLRADRGHILRATANFRGKPASAWLSPRHPAGSGSLPSSWQQVLKLPAQQLIEAVAAAAPNHCIDGWSYVSRAMSALLAGDLHAARHLSYYAELRAGLSLLGSLGIGIFNGINFVVD